MTGLSRGARLLPASLALLLAAGTFASVSAPAQALRTTFGNTGGISIADPVQQLQNTDITIPDNDQADAYPSTIEVDEPGEITDVNLRLNNVDHAVPDDVDILLVGPTGEQATVMSDAGGALAIADADVTLDDQAPTALPDSAQIVSGSSYRPGNYNGTDDFPSPAPTDTGDSALSVFNGTDPAGVWQLFVVDDAAGQAGLIDGWVLDIHVKSDPYPSTVEVAGLGSEITDLDLSLDGLTHGFSSDVDVLLVGPHGQYATVLSDVGGTEAVVDVDLVLDDEAPTALPAAANLTTGTFRPTNNETTDAFPAPAPTPSGASALSAFDGSDPNGSWSLYVIDDAANDEGTLVGWSLDIETDDTPPTGTVAINGGKRVSTSRTVTLALAASDPGSPSSGVEAVRVSNDGVTFSAPLAYAPTRSWTLARGDGTKTVWVKFVDASGLESTAVSDTIKLDTTGPKAVRLTPGNHAKAVKVTTKVRIVASERLRKGSVSATTVILKARSGKVAAAVSYAAATRTITIAPRSALRHHTTYTVIVRGVKDLNGLTWDQKPQVGAQALRFSFTTA